MSPAIDAAAKAIAKVEGDPDTLVEVSTKNGLTRVPLWQLYRVRAKAALDAARDAICHVMEGEFDEGEDYWDGSRHIHEVSPEIDAIRAAYDRAMTP